MDVWRQKNCQKLNEIESVLEFFTNANTNEQLIYSNCLNFIRLLKSSDLIEQIKNLYSDRYYCQPLQIQQFDNFILDTIKIIPIFTGKDEEFVDGLNLLQDYFLNQNMNSFCQALLKNKILLEKHPKIMLTIFSKIINSDNQKVYFKLISFLGQNQLKSYHHIFLKEIIDIDLQTKQLFFNFLKRNFDVFLSEAEKFQQSLKQYGVTSLEIIQTYKRLIKWQSYKYYFIIQRLDEQFTDKQNNQDIIKLIFYIMTSSISHLWINQSNLIKSIKQLWKSQDQEFRFQRILKFMRINNHRDNDQSYRMGYNGLIGQKIDSFRLASDFELMIKKALVEKDNQVLYLSLIKQAFQREPYTFSFSFIEFLIQLPYEDNPQLYQTFWSVISKIYKYFFINLYEQDIVNLFDFSGMFVDENGITKLITKTGNLKKSARNLIPLIQKLIVNSSQIIVYIYKRFHKLFLCDKQIMNFFTNFIYEPLIHQIEQQIPENQDFKNNPTIQLYHQFPKIVDNFSEINKFFNLYLSDLMKLFSVDTQVKPMKMKGQFSQLISKFSQIQIEELTLQILKQFHQKLMLEIFVNQNEINLAFNQQQYQNFKSGLQLLLKQQQPFTNLFCQELKLLQDVILINYSINLNTSLNSHCSQSFFSCLLKCQLNQPEIFYSKQLSILFSQFDSILQNCGYEIQEYQMTDQQQLSEIDEIDQDGQYFQKIITTTSQFANIQSRQIPLCKQSYQIIIFLQLINQLLSNIQKYDFEVEYLSQQLRKILSHKYIYDDLIIEIWNQIYLILEKLNTQSSEKWLEINKSKLYNNIIHLDQTISVTTTLIISLIMNQNKLNNSKINLEKLIQIISEMKNQKQKQTLYRVIFENLNQIDLTFLDNFIFKIDDNYLKQQCIISFLNDIKYQNSANVFMFLIKLFLNIDLHWMQTYIIQYLSENLFSIGMRNLIVILLGRFVKQKKTKIYAKKLIMQYTEFLQQSIQILYALGQDLFSLLLNLNSVIFIIFSCKKYITVCQTYWLFRKFLKQFFTPKIRQNSKKLQSVISFIQRFIDWSGVITPKQVEIEFPLFDYLDVNYQKLPEKIVQKTTVIKDQQEIFNILQLYVNEIQSGIKRQIDQQKKEVQQQIEIIDSMLFDINFESQRAALKSKQQSQSIHSIQLKNNSTKNIEKLTKGLDLGIQLQK